MKRIITAIAAAGAMCMLAACEPTAPPQPERKPDPTGSAAATRDPYAPIERAKAVEGDVLEQKEAQDRAMEAQGG